MKGLLAFVAWRDEIAPELAQVHDEAVKAFEDKFNDADLVEVARMGFATYLVDFLNRATPRVHNGVVLNDEELEAFKFGMEMAAAEVSAFQAGVGDN